MLHSTDDEHLTGSPCGLPARALPVDPDLERILAALDNDNADQQRIAAAGIVLVATLLRKNADYGGSAWAAPILKPDMQPGDALLARMSDKVQRISRLTQHDAEVATESLADAINDLTGYGLLWLSRPLSNITTD